MLPTWSFADDLSAVFTALEDEWRTLRGARLFFTGATGFIGRWMLESLAEANKRLDLGVEVIALSRNPATFTAIAPHLVAQPGLRLLAGDVTNFTKPDGAFSHVIHAATDASAALNASDPRRMFDVIVSGTRRTLDFAAACGAGRYFFFSSGAVYGAQPWEMLHVTEDWRGGPDPQDARAAYAEGKRAAEMQCAIYARQFGLDIVNARIFALLGPLLSLDIHFAAGNFISDALAGRIIRVEGAGTAVRSYLYPTDLTIWLWTILLRARPGAVYNVGSEEAVSIAELAARVAGLLGAAGHEVLGRPDPGWNPGRYVPSTALIRGELGVTPTVRLDDAIMRTAIWNGWTG